MAETKTQDNPETTPAETLGEKTIKQMLAEQEKVTVRLYQGRTPADKLPDQVVGISGHNFQIKRGVPVDVPRSVYEVLVQAGQIDPLPGDEHMAPTYRTVALDPNTD